MRAALPQFLRLVLGGSPTLIGSFQLAQTLRGHRTNGIPAVDASYGLLTRPSHRHR